METTRELDDLLLQLKGLALVRGLLETRGATEAEIREHTDEIERLRGRITGLVATKGGGAQRAAA